MADLPSPAVIRALLQALDGTLVAGAPARSLLFASDPAIEALGRQLCGDGEVRAYHADGRPLPPSEWPLLRSLATGEPATGGPFDLQWPDGTWGTVDAAAFPVRDAAGQTAAAAMTVRDATPRYNARLFLQTISGIVDAVDTNLAAGDAMQAILAVVGRGLGGRAAVFWTPAGGGQQLAAGAEWTAEGALPERGGPGLAQRTWQSAAAVVEPRGAVGVPVRVDGLPVAVLTVFRPSARPPDPDLLQFIECIAGAIGQLHRWDRVRRALERASARLQALLESAPVPVKLLDASGRILEWSRAAESLYGWPRAEMLGRPLYDTPFVPPSERANTQRQIEQVFQRRKPVQGAIVKRQRRDGGSLDVSLFLAPIVDGREGAEGLVAVDLDVTDRMRFLEVAVHEIRNPITSIKGIVSLIRRSAVQGDTIADLDPLLQVVEGEVDRLAGMADEIIDGFRAAAGDLRHNPQPVELGEVVAAALRPFAAVEPGRFRLDVSARAPVLADPQRLGDVFRNLVANSRKYSPPDSEVSVTLSVGGEQARVTVRDRGIGIPPDELERIFAPFCRASNAEPGGLGLGLYRCRSIVKEHGGRIWAENRPEGGARFVVELPLRPEN